MSLRLSSSLLFLLMFFAGIGVAQNKLTVAAAADLAPLEPDLQKAFPPLRFVTSASGVLAQQIENGAPYDVFLSANASYVERLLKTGKIEPSSVVVYTKGQLGLLWRDGKSRKINGLTESWVRFAGLPDPKLAPYGVAAIESLRHAGIWRLVQPKVVYAENVRQTLQLLTSGNADAVITSGSLLIGKNVQWIPDSWHSPILQKAGVIAGTRNGAAARRFLAFLVSPAGQAIFSKYGFARMGPPAKH